MPPVETSPAQRKANLAALDAHAQARESDVVQHVCCSVEDAGGRCPSAYGVVRFVDQWQIEVQAACTGWRVSAEGQLLCPEHAHRGDEAALRSACERWWMAWQHQQQGRVPQGRRSKR